MNPFPSQTRRIKRQLANLKGYLALDRHGNEVVRRADFEHGDKPVLLIYDVLATRRVFELFEERLRRDGFCVWSINLGGRFDAFNTRGIDECAELVRDKVEDLYARYNLGPLSIIGHSKGGLIGRYYVKRLGGEKRCRTLITLGTAHHGTPTAYAGVAAMGLVSKSVWQMTPMSPFIRRLQMGAFPRGVRLVSIYSKADRINPFPSCILETHRGPNLFNIELPGVGHREFVLKRSVYAVVRHELALGLGEEPDSRAPTRPHLIEP